MRIPADLLHEKIDKIRQGAYVLYVDCEGFTIHGPLKRHSGRPKTVIQVESRH